MSSTFSCAYRLLIYILWRNVYSNPLPILKLSYLSTSSYGLLTPIHSFNFSKLLLHTRHHKNSKFSNVCCRSLVIRQQKAGSHLWSQYNCDFTVVRNYQKVADWFVTDHIIKWIPQQRSYPNPSGPYSMNVLFLLLEAKIILKQKEKSHLNLHNGSLKWS